MDEQLVDALRRRSEHGVAPDVDTSFGVARAGAVKRRRRRRVVITAVAACAVLVVGGVFVAVAATGSDDSVQVAVPPSDDPPVTARPDALQFRPVLGPIAPEDPAVPVDDAARSAVASCAFADVATFGQAVPTTPADAVDPEACVVLAQDGGRYLLGPSQVDGSAVATAKKDFRSGMGWVVDMTFTPTGATAVDDLARQQFHRQMALVADGALVGAPTIQPSDAEFVSFGGHLLVSVPTEAAADAVVRAVGAR